MEYSFEILKLEDLDELCSLIKIVFKKDSKYVINKTRWAFDNNHSCVMVAKYNGKIVASRGGFNWPLAINNNKINAIQFHGTSVHPDHRRRGLFSKLNKQYIRYASDNEIDYIFNVSVKISRLGYEKLGWKYIEGFHRLTFFNKPIKYLKSIRDKTPTIRQNSGNTDKIELIKDSFLEARKHQFENVVYTDYSRDFIEWRLNNSEENYKVYQRDGVYIVYKIIQTNKLKSLVFGDFFLMKNSRSLFSRALKEVMRIENPDITFTYISRSHPYFSHYIYNLFLPNPLNFNLNFGTRFISSDEEKNLSGKKWATSFLDIDTF